MGLKPLLPTLKEKKRYVVYAVRSEMRHGLPEVRDIVERAALSFLGKLEYAKAGIMILNDFRNNKGIIRVNRHYVDKLKAALMLINSNMMVSCVYVSGILKKAKKMEV